MSRSKCCMAIYRTFLQVTCVRHSCLALSEVSPVEMSHDSASRWLQSQNFRPHEVWKIARKNIDPHEPGLLVVDDTVLDKNRSKEIDLVHRQYSGNEHGIISGIGLVNLVYYGFKSNQLIPIDYRVNNKDDDGKTKNDHCREMLKLAKKRLPAVTTVAMDAWYSSLGNLKAIRELGMTWVAGLKKNRRVNKKEVLEKLQVPEEGLRLHLRGYGWITVFRFVAKNGRTDYIGTNMENPSRDSIEKIFRSRWEVEVYHRELKQTCGIERCRARTGRAQRNHIFLAIAAWFEKHMRRCLEGVTLYHQQWNVIKPAIATQMRLAM